MMNEFTHHVEVWNRVLHRFHPSKDYSMILDWWESINRIIRHPWEPLWCDCCEHRLRDIIIAICGPIEESDCGCTPKCSDYLASLSTDNFRVNGIGKTKVAALVQLADAIELQRGDTSIADVTPRILRPRILPRVQS